jgi:hypothetical protein
MERGEVGALEIQLTVGAVALADRADTNCSASAAHQFGGTGSWPIDC